MTIGENIKIKRKQFGLTQQEMANYLCKSLRMIQKYENDEVTPSIKILQAIAIILDTSLDELVASNTNGKDELAKAAFESLRKLLYSKKCSGSTIYKPTGSEGLIKDMEKQFSFSFPNMYDEVEEDTIAKMLYSIINNNLNEFVKLFKIYNEVILSFDKKNLTYINKALKVSNLSLEKMNKDLYIQANLLSTTQVNRELNKNYIAIEALYKIYSSFDIEMINSNTLNTDILVNIYNDPDFKDCLLYLKKKYTLKEKINRIGDNIDNKES